ncbi:MAG: hypothetical protein AAF138_08950 [Planctomycetota bacterium]
MGMLTDFAQTTMAYIPTLAEPGESLFSMDNILGWIALALVVLGGAVAGFWAKVKAKFGRGGDDTSEGGFGDE